MEKMKYSHSHLLAPKDLFQEFPLTLTIQENVEQSRKITQQIIQGIDRRLLVIVGPCSIHDTNAALEYAHLLSKAAQHFADELYLIMRVYIEKPRTTLGWKGLVNDPFLDNTFDMNSGLKLARKLLLDINKLGIPTATEFLDTIIPPYLSDLMTWSVIGARTSASQIHRELASALPMAVGFKNSIDGNIKTAIEAVQVASQPHSYRSIHLDGSPGIFKTPGNSACHIILRGSYHGPNYDSHHVQQTTKALHEANISTRIVIDCSHGNSLKDYQRQPLVAKEVVSQIKQGSKMIAGLMLESNLIAGHQSLQNHTPLVYGQSITDACISWNETWNVLENLALELAPQLHTLI